MFSCVCFFPGSCWRGWNCWWYRSKGKSVCIGYFLCFIAKYFPSYTVFKLPFSQKSFILSFHPIRNCFMSLSFDCPRREREALQEREVKLDPMACQDLRVVQVDQDQMGQRYIKTCKRKPFAIFQLVACLQ